MEYENIECVECKTKEKPLFMRSPPRHKDDVYCRKCMDAGKHLD